MIASCLSPKNIETRQTDTDYVIKMESSCNDTNGVELKGFKLTLLPYRKPKGYTPYPCTYGEDKVFAGYPNKEKIKVLAALLQFAGDTSLCSKRVCNYGFVKLPKPQAITYTIQVDALYLLTSLTASSFSPGYCPYPVLWDTLTKKEINNDPVKLAEVFEIYKKWFKENADRDFKDYNLPLRNSRYEWYGTDRKKAFMFSDTFKIKKLDASAIVIGSCRE